jgi:hypothetical protein
MPRYRFAAVDSSGTVHDGTINAATESEARNKLASNGLAVRKVEEATSSAEDAPLVEAPRRPASKSMPPTAMPARAPVIEETEAPRRRGSPWPFIFSLLALLVAVSTAVYVVYRDPPGGRLSKYDFRTPEAAAISYAKIEGNNDFRAQMELMNKLYGKYAREKANTLDVGKTLTHRSGMQVVFLNYTHDNMPIHEVQWFEKDADTGMWQPTHSPPDVQNTPLGQEIREWLSQAGFVPPKGPLEGIRD